jgi:opacity protein-like surface antigen
MRLFLFGSVLFLIAGAPATAAEDGHHPNHIAFLVGNPQEVKDGERTSGGMLGIAYERRLSERWLFTAAWEQEAFGDKTQRHTVVFAGAGYDITDHWRVFGGPGAEGRKLGERDHFLMRVGTGYHFGLRGNWTLTPELSIDFVEGGNRVYVFALALGYGF